VIEKILSKIKSEPVRVRLYSIIAVVAVFALAKGYVQANDLEFILSLAALVLGVERSRAQVKPVAKRRKV
jgi:hydrogenase/urease accessory protein HupE